MHDQADLIKYANYYNVNFENFNEIKNVENRTHEDWGELYLKIADGLKLDGNAESKKLIVENELNEYFNHTCFGTIRTVGNFPYQAEFEPDTYEWNQKKALKIINRKGFKKSKSNKKIALACDSIINVGNDSNEDTLSTNSKLLAEKRFTYFLNLLRNQNQTQTTAIYERRFHVRQMLWALNDWKNKKDKLIAHKTEECKKVKLSLFVPKSNKKQKNNDLLTYKYNDDIKKKLDIIFKKLEKRGIKHTRDDAVLETWITHEAQWRDVLSINNEIIGKNLTKWEHHPRHDILESLGKKLNKDKPNRQEEDDIRRLLRNYFNSDEGEIICLNHKQIKEKEIRWQEKFTFEVKYVEKITKNDKGKSEAIWKTKAFTECIEMVRNEYRPYLDENLKAISSHEISKNGLKIVQMSRTNGSKGLCCGKFNFI